MTTYDETTLAALLEAGAVLPPGSTAREDADTLTVRTYTHPALDDRQVVRLVPGTLGEAEDLALEFLGLAREPEAPEVGQVRRETLGFPAWALVHDPANGHHALALVKDVERLARQAKSRPGSAKQGFEELGARLGRAVPHFLPTFYEQAARAFLQHENTTYAAAFFGRAREAERVHALAVDEERQRAVFLEFAFAGALTVKALKEHVKDLGRRLDPAAAWAQFRQLTVERCAAGMPPYASLPQDARGLIKAAGLDREAEERALVADLLTSPAAVRAPASFWTAYRPVLGALAEERPEVRTRLLEIMPAGLGRGVENDEFWLALLAETGADRLLTDETAARAHGVDAADWLTRWALHRKRGSAFADRSPATLVLAARMAPLLRSAGRPVDLFAGNWGASAHLDLLDLCVAEGVPLSVPAPGDAVRLSVTHWLSDTGEGRRDLVALAADPRVRPLLHSAVEDAGPRYGRRDEQLKALAAHPVLSELLREWLDEVSGEFTRAAGLPAASATLDRLRPFRPVALGAGPEAVARIAAHPVAPLLGRTLRAGVLDELGWPALEEALDLLDAQTLDPKNPRREVTVHEAWPALIVSRGHKALVVGPEKILLDHDLRLPQDLDRHQRPRFRHVDGELLVIWRQDGKQRAYWSSRPAEVFALGGEQIPTWWYGQDDLAASIPLPGGGRASGGRALHAGDTALPPSRPVLGDGTGYWREGRQGVRTVWLEYDPVTGGHGRASLPAPLRAGVREDAELMAGMCELLPLRPGLEQSPFGTDGTVLGRWVRTEGDTGERFRTAGTPDGRTVSMPVTDAVPLGALRLPGAEPVVARMSQTVALFAGDDRDATGRLGHVTPNGPGGEFAAGTPLVPPLPFWHALRPRDERGSAVLRAVTDEQAAELMRGTAEVLAGRQAALKRAGDDKGAREAVPSEAELTVRVVREELPGLTDARLILGVASLVRSALRLDGSATAFAEPPKERPAQRREHTEGMFWDYSPEHGEDSTLREALAGIVSVYGYWHGEQRTTLRQIRAVNHVLSGHAAHGKPLPAAERDAVLTDGWRSETHTVPGIGLGWPAALGALRALAFRAASATLSEARREALLLLFEALGEGPLVSGPGTLREVTLSEPYDRLDRFGQVLRRGERTVVILGSQRVDQLRKRTDWLAVDHDPSGAFGPVAHFALSDEVRHDPGISGADLAAVTRLIRAKGAAPWQSGAPEMLTAATGGGLGPVQATALLAALPPEPGAETLALTGLKSRQCAYGVSRLGRLPAETRNALLGALLPADPEALWTSGPDTGAAGRVWADRLGSALRLPEDVDAELAGMTAEYAEDVLNPARTPWLARTTRLRPDANGELGPEDPAALPGGRSLSGAVTALAALAYVLPYGHPLRAALPEGLAAVRRRMADPELLLDAEVGWTEKGTPTSAEVRKAYGLPTTGGADALGLTPVGEALVLRPWYHGEAVLLRTAALSGPDDPVFGLLEGLVGPERGDHLRPLSTVLGPELERAVAAGADGPRGHAQDPSVSVPELVAEVAATHGLGEDAAVLYLQLLALPDPTDRDRARWTGWKPARAKKARTELVASGLVVEAKRPRAGRTLFLPCGWRDLKSPALPVETWKEGLYPVPVRRRAVPLLPVPELFTRAWERVRSGDGPAYEELTTRANRRGRRR
ncbi:hypothetical protein [Streptomyces sp. LaPpAH-108]|uniref:hypothetical protein n=1 Tax=Streptomyces sp. LaPpAH-108 TaxID=1155714 RepID=UPI000366D0C1|nr:hypothetical protein [Streptomyces sp. LaPpAH-108]